MTLPAYSLGVVNRIKSIPIAIQGMGPLVAFAARTMHFTWPERAALMGATLDVGARGGTHSTSTLDLQEATVSLLTAVFDIAALTASTPVVKDGTAIAAAGSEVAKDAEMSVVLVESGGTSPTFAATLLTLYYVPLGD